LRSQKDIDAVIVALHRNPTKSTKKAAAQLGTSRQLVQRILKSDLNLYPYKMTTLLKLTFQNKYQRIAFAEWAKNNDVSFNYVWFCDEAMSTWMV
jgi:hypothetical protein